MASPLLRNVVLPATVSFICVLLIGGLLLGDRIFNVLSPTVVFPVYGVTFSAFLFFFRYHRRNALAMLVVLYLLNEVLINRSVGYGLFGRDLIYFCFLGAGVVFYVSFFNPSKTWNHLLAPLVLGFIFFLAIIGGLAVLYLWWRLYRAHGFMDYMKAAMSVYVPSVFLVGVGIGLGVLLHERGLTEFLLRQWKRIVKHLSA